MKRLLSLRLSIILPFASVLFLLSACDQADSLNGPSQEVEDQLNGKISDLSMHNGSRYAVLYHTPDNLDEIAKNSSCRIWNDDGDVIIREPCATLQLGGDAPSRAYLAFAITLEHESGFTDYEATWSFVW
ncbi:MAG: hypothetical protein F4Y00_03145 [Bacteroidetes bacterium SB0662_bin_6]|nr:hypothetical protein [Bacteroidetes bacterium SB0662_bin_6]